MAKMLTEQQVRDLVRKLVGNGKQQDAARQLGIGDAYLSNFLSGRYAPGKPLLAGLGMERVVLYRSVK